MTNKESFILFGLMAMGVISSYTAFDSARSEYRQYLRLKDQFEKDPVVLQANDLKRIQDLLTYATWNLSYNPRAEMVQAKNSIQVEPTLKLPHPKNARVELFEAAKELEKFDLELAKKTKQQATQLPADDTADQDIFKPQIENIRALSTKLKSLQELNEAHFPHDLQDRMEQSHDQSTSLYRWALGFVITTAVGGIVYTRKYETSESS